SKPTCRQNRCCKNGSDHRFRFPYSPLNELGFNSDWIEKCLAHEDGRSSRGVYNKAEYEVQRRHMMQQWADTVDAWIDGRKYAPALLPQAMPLMELDPAL
ncbi:hypothetical protein ACV1CY_23070, partial [Aeromonas caviae]